uniref:SP110 nuclear body protein n=1 Tax=Suricata suricatta TaxID=37032 RepID=A0A673UX57_SURSU
LYVSVMFTMTRALQETLLQHFIYQKLEIAYAIHKPFPFLEGLRDNSFITETMYRESVEAYRNQVPVSRVVYNILTHLEKMFSLSCLQMLFSQINLREYPNLMTILKSFRSVVISYGGWNRAEPIFLEAPANSAEGSSLQTLLSLPPPQHQPQSLSPCAPSVNEPSASTQHSTEILGEPSSPAGPAVALSRATQKGRITPGKKQTLSNTCVSLIRDDSPELNDPKELQEASSTLPNKKGKEGKRRRFTGNPNLNYSQIPQAASPKHRIQEKLQVVDQATERKDDSTRNSEVMTRAQKARTGCTQTSGPEEKKGKKEVSSSSTRRCQKNIPPKEEPEDESVDFHSPELPVTCGEAKGILYKEKLKQGSSEKCIQNEEGVWFTPKEFEIEGNRATSKKWKRSVHCRGKTLEELLKKGFLLCPPRISVKRKGGNSKECEVCCRGGPLLCCVTCPRAFHEDCHIPPAEAERSPWSCTFCKMESSGRQQCHGKPEVLERQMQPEEQLKCEFLLLKAYCHPQSSFFAETPYNICDYGEPFKEAMWLDLVKERLTEKVYTVTWFVRDMRLIFYNHKMFYKTSDLGQIGLDLEAEFEKDLKEMFNFCKAKENSFQTL